MSEIIKTESNSDYHKNHAVSHSKLSDFIEMPLLYKLKHIDKLIPNEQTKAMKIGSAIHCATLEGWDKFYKQYAVAEKGFDGRTKAGKAELERMAETGQDLLTWDEYEIVDGASQSAGLRMPINGVQFSEIVFRHNLGPFEIQSRLDLWCPNEGDNGTIYDLKTCGSFRQFESNFWEHGYYRQAAFYQSVVREVLAEKNGSKPEDLEFPAFKFVAVTTEFPHLCQVYEPPSDALAIGHKQIEKALGELAECLKTGHWPGAKEGIQTIEFPQWRRDKLLREIE